MAGDTANSFLNDFARTKQGNDTIFSCWARYQQAVAEGHDAVNGTIGALLENDGSLAINQTVDKFVRSSPPIEIAAYAPLKGLPEFLDLAVTLALGEARGELESIGVHHTATASPGGSGALFLAAANYADRGSKVLLRDRHWGPYDGFLAGCGLGIATYPLLNEAQCLDLPGLKDSLTNLAKSQSKVMSWLNDPAHNPTGLSLTESERMGVLRAFANVAMEYEDVGFTLLIDAAYHVYAKEPHGWAETLTNALHDGMEWPANLLLTFAISLSKSHTVYGLRGGALVSIHPDESVVERITTVMGVTGRQTWSASSRLAQYSIAKIHSNSESGAAWSDEKLRLTKILQERRDLFIATCEKLEVPINPTHDGFFAWLEHDNPAKIVESCAQEQVYLVPLNGGIRIGLCAIPTDKIERVAISLSNALKE
ncbi:MAG: aminotransferase class I/II-fold pyridoxal phosphate-dependent enzyme [Candidatus Thermoplasmatota archaeon]|nr:aminotransferase class I/II-fold pyridoxal phosphate-dependent enzyme [Candidatus Thermoplasmatota archaeon]